MMLRSSVFARVSFTLAASFIISCGGSDPGPDAGAGGGSAGSGGGAAGAAGGAAGAGGGAAGSGWRRGWHRRRRAGRAVARRRRQCRHRRRRGGHRRRTRRARPAAARPGAAAAPVARRAGAAAAAALAGSTGTGGRGGSGGAVTASPMMNFFVSSDTSTTANLGGLAAADARCQTLAAAVGQGAKTWRAYLCAASPATNARDRIGAGPYYNSAGMMLAADKDALHARSGDAALFIDERGARINGQWSGSPSPNQHDILTGCTAMGMLMTGNTCSDWTSTRRA